MAINGNTDRRPPMSLVLSGRVMSNALLLLACLHLVKQELRSTATPQPDIMSLRGENRFSFSSFFFFRYQAVSNTNFRAILTQLPCASLAPKLSFSLSQCFSRRLNFFLNLRHTKQRIDQLGKISTFTVAISAADAATRRRYNQICKRASSVWFFFRTLHVCGCVRGGANFWRRFCFHGIKTVVL